VKKSRYSEEQISYALKQAETGTPVAEVLRRMGIPEQTFYRWKKLYGGLGVGELRRLRQLRTRTGSPSNWSSTPAWTRIFCRRFCQKKSEACSAARDRPVCPVGPWGQRAAQLRSADF
jgi:putative transposase